MMGILRRSHIYTLAMLLVFIYTYLLSSDISSLRELLNREYLKHKEFMFMLNNLELREDTLNEKLIRSIAMSMGLEIKSISETPSGIEVVLPQVRASLLPQLLFQIERYGRIKSLSSEDNTGKGIFEVRLVIQP
jgi:hypothetical protein